MMMILKPAHLASDERDCDELMWCGGGNGNGNQCFFSRVYPQDGQVMHTYGQVMSVQAVLHERCFAYNIFRSWPFKRGWSQEG